jgi:predicted SprT family Zn-dependent metalloprotease
VEVTPAPGSTERSELPPVAELYRLFDVYNKVYFGGKLPSVKVEYSNRMFSAGSYSPSRKLIRIGRKYHEIYPQDIEDTLKHEMIHIRHHRHDARFRAEAERVGASLRAREHPELRRPPRYIYECPGCGMEYPRQKRLVMASCGRCSRGRRFDPRFKLRRKKTLRPTIREAAKQ